MSSVVPKVLLEAFDEIFNSRFLKLKKCEQNKENFKKLSENKKMQKRFLSSYCEPH